MIVMFEFKVTVPCSIWAKCTHLWFLKVSWASLMQALRFTKWKFASGNPSKDCLITHLILPCDVKNHNPTCSYARILHKATSHIIGLKKCSTPKYREKCIYFVLTGHILYHKHLTHTNVYIFWKLTVQRFHWYRA